MRISYDKLWKLMKKKQTQKSELATAAEISGIYKPPKYSGKNLRFLKSLFTDYDLHPFLDPEL